MITIIYAFLLLKQITTTTRYYCSLSNTNLSTCKKKTQTRQNGFKHTENAIFKHECKNTDAQCSKISTKDIGVVKKEEFPNPIQSISNLTANITINSEESLLNAERPSLQHANGYKNAEKEVIEMHGDILSCDKDISNTLALLLKAQKTIEEQEILLQTSYTKCVQLEHDMKNAYNKAIIKKTEQLTSNLKLAKQNLAKLKEERELILLQLSELELGLSNSKKRECIIENKREGWYGNPESNSVKQDDSEDKSEKNSINKSEDDSENDSEHNSEEYSEDNSEEDLEGNSEEDSEDEYFLENSSEPLTILKNDNRGKISNLLIINDPIQIQNDIGVIENMLEKNKSEIKIIQEEICKINMLMPPDKNDVYSEELSSILNEQISIEKNIRMSKYLIKKTQIEISQMIPDLLSVIIDIKTSVDTQSNAEILNSTKTSEELITKDEEIQNKESHISDCKVKNKQIIAPKDHCLENFVTDRNEELKQLDDLYDQFKSETPGLDFTVGSLKVNSQAKNEFDQNKAIKTFFELITAQNTVINIPADLNKAYINVLPEKIETSTQNNDNITSKQLEADLIITKQRVTCLHERLTNEMKSFTEEEIKQVDLFNATITKTKQPEIDKQLANDELKILEKKSDELQNSPSPCLFKSDGSSERANRIAENMQDVNKLRKDNAETRNAIWRKLLKIIKKDK
ncbi:hypothetical protein COBT_001464 [Conglomerata obtusa]